MPVQYPENLYKYPSKVFQIIRTPSSNDNGDNNDNCSSNNNYYEQLTLYQQQQYIRLNKSQYPIEAFPPSF